MKDNADDEKLPISIRIPRPMADELKGLTGKDSVAAGVIYLYEFYKGHSKESGSDTDELRSLEIEIGELKDSPFGFDKKEIALLERELEKAKDKFKKKKAESLKERLLKLVNSAS